MTERYREFVLYFEELDKIGAPYGTGDLIRKAKELELSIPIVLIEDIVGSIPANGLAL